MTLRLTVTRTRSVAVVFPSGAGVSAPTKPRVARPQSTATVATAAGRRGGAAARRCALAARRRGLLLADSWREHTMDLVSVEACR